jgi:hypothetical protein
MIFLCEAANGRSRLPNRRSVRGVRISDLITGRIFAVASLYATPECADGRALTGAAEAHAFYPPPLGTAPHSPKSRII